MTVGRWAIKTGLICAYLAFDYRAIFARIADLGPSLSLGVFLFLFALLTVGLLLTGAIRNTWLRATWAFILCAASLFLQSSERVTHGTLSYEAFINLYNARGNMDEALAQHGAILLHLIIPTALLFLGLTLAPKRSKLPWWIPVGAPIATVGLLSAMLFVRGGEGTGALPAPFTPVAYSALMGFETLQEDHKPHRDVEIKRTAPAPQRDIVLLVDESIAGNYLDINNPDGVVSGLKTAPPTVSITNYGYAASVHNCSATSNIVLRYGGTRDTYQRTIKHYPSIWRYAKQAGMRTVYIDAQGEGGKLQNLMTPSERADIDDFIQLDKVPVLNRDMAVADALSAHINNGRPEFIYVNKVGAHFPIQDKYPDRMIHYKPVLERGHTGNLSWSSDRTGFNGTPPEWVLYRNSYRNSLLWNVGEFFHRFFAKTDLSKATIIYTSDHGQDLHEHHNPGNNTHCGTGHPVEQEGLVPLLVIEGKGHAARDWGKGFAGNRNNLSHFRIFPTLLEMMGYDGAGVRPLYGPPIDDPAPDDLSFNTHFYTQLGRKPEWQKIDLSKVISPPVSDYQKGQ